MPCAEGCAVYIDCVELQLEGCRCDVGHGVALAIDLGRVAPANSLCRVGDLDALDVHGVAVDQVVGGTRCNHNRIGLGVASDGIRRVEGQSAVHMEGVLKIGDVVVVQPLDVLHRPAVDAALDDRVKEVVVSLLHGGDRLE